MVHPFTLNECVHVPDDEVHAAVLARWRRLNPWALGRFGRVHGEDFRRAVPEPEGVSVHGETLGRLASGHVRDALP